MAGILQPIGPRIRGCFFGYFHRPQHGAGCNPRSAGCLYRHLHRGLGTGMDRCQGDILRHLGWHRGHPLCRAGNHQGHCKRGAGLVRYKLGGMLGWHQDLLRGCLERDQQLFLRHTHRDTDSGDYGVDGNQHILLYDFRHHLLHGVDRVECY